MRGCAPGSLSLRINPEKSPEPTGPPEAAMNKITRKNEFAAGVITTGPLPSSRKIYATPDSAPDLRVPLREIILSEGAGEPNLPVYDTSGPYTDPQATIDVNAG